LAHSLQKFSRLYEKVGTEKQTELKELRIILALYFASPTNKTLLSEFGSTLFELLKRFVRDENHLPSKSLQIESRNASSFTLFLLFPVEVMIGLFRKNKKSSKTIRLEISHPRLVPFWTNFEKLGIRRDYVYPEGFNLCKAR